MYENSAISLIDKLLAFYEVLTNISTVIVLQPFQLHVFFYLRMWQRIIRETTAGENRSYAQSLH